MSVDSPGAQKQKSGGGGKKWILIVLAVLFLLLIGCGGFCYWASTALWGAAMAPVNDTIEVISQNEELKEKLGSPIEQVPITKGGKYNLDSSTDAGTELTFTIKGPKGQADVEGKVELFGKKWKPSYLTITFDDGTTMVIE